MGDLAAAALLGAPVPRPPAPSLDGIVLTDEYQTVLRLLDQQYPLILVSGKAGTGKSTLVKVLRARLKKNLVVVAPTGIAALNIGGATIHSFFRFPPRVVTEADIQRLDSEDLYRYVELLVVDEISMVRADVLDAMDKFLRLNGRYCNRPFGGVQMLFIGDLFQLPPVVTPGEQRLLDERGYASPFFFSAKCLEHCRVAPVELTRVFRQTDAEFTATLNKIRVAEDLPRVIPPLNRRCFREPADQPPLLTLSCTNTVVSEVNRAHLDRLAGEPALYPGALTGRTLSLEGGKLPAPSQLALKPDAQVMFTRNDENRRWVNGTLGRVTGLADDAVQVELITDQPGTTVEAGRVKWEFYRYAMDKQTDTIVPVVVGTYCQFPLTPAWAITIHKSQGKTLERVRVDLGRGAFAPGQVYVALSRCRSRDDLTLAQPIHETHVICDPRIKRFYAAIEDQCAPVADPEPLAADACPYCGAQLTLRHGRNGPFYGCRNYPACRFTRNPA